MQSAALAVRLLVLGLAVYLLFEGLPVLERIRRGAQRPAPARLPPEFDWVDKSKGLRILHFYASPGAIHRGEEISLCYGVAQAVAARIESVPGGLLPGISPSLNRCVIAAPQRNTRYTLVAEDGTGAHRELSLEVTVLPPSRSQSTSPPPVQPRREGSPQR